MPNEKEKLELKEMKIDGQESVQMQIDIHLMDLVDNIEPGIIFTGLLYLANYRLPQLTDLDFELMKRLLEILLDYIKDYSDAFLVFTYFCKFPSFIKAISLVNVGYLKKRLGLHKKISDFRPQVVYVLQQIQGLPNINTNELIDNLDLLKESEIAQITSLPAMNILPPQLLYTEKSVERLFDMFKTSKQGLDSDQVERHTQFYGNNSLPVPPKPNPLRMLFDQFKDFMIVLLIVVIIIEAALQSFDAAGILSAVVVLNVLIGFVQELKANRAMQALSNLTIPTALVIRNGKQESILASALVPGDIVVLNEGGFIPSDSRVIESNNLQVIESILTGESLAIPKSPDAIRNKQQRVPIGECTGNVFMSTVVAKGTGLVLVVRTGNTSEIGRISSAIQNAKQPPSLIQRKLAKLGMILVAAAIVLCVIFVGIGIAWGNDVVETIQFGMVLAISAIPEGLVAVVTVTMALGVSRMAKRNAIVRKLPIVETLGSLTTICSDKTGTLTVGKMGLKMIQTDELFEFKNPTSLNRKDNALINKDNLPVNGQHASLAIFSMICSCCVNASIVEEDGAFKGLGDATEVPLVAATEKLDMPKSKFLQMGFEKQSENAFDSERKLMSVQYKNKDMTILLVKGAPEEVLENCTSNFKESTLDLQQTISTLQELQYPMTSDLKKKHLDTANAMASKGLRVLGLAFKLSDNSDETNLCFVGYAGLIDPPKPGVKESIARARSGGINVVMITGDHINTATAIAKDIGIITGNFRAMRGHEIDALKPEELQRLQPFPSVFARVSPDNKLKIVQALQAQGNVVAMTGDGVNDASAIKQADVGICMGLSGTEITKQAADVILADDDFTTIIAAVEEGRRVFDNIMKFIVYLLSCNSAEIFLMLFSAIINVPLPYTAKSTLWANIIADVPPAMSLGVEPAEKGIMERKPRNPKAAVVSREVAIMILIQGMFLTLITLTVYLISLKVEGINEGVCKSIAFTSLTTMQLVQSFWSKSTSASVFKSGITSNKYMIFAFILSFTVMVIGIYAPYLNDFLTLVPIDGFGWLKVFICVSVQFVGCEFIKWSYRKYLNRKNYQLINNV